MKINGYNNDDYSKLIHYISEDEETSANKHTAPLLEDNKPDKVIIDKPKQNPETKTIEEKPVNVIGVKESSEDDLPLKETSNEKEKVSGLMATGSYWLCRN